MATETRSIAGTEWAAAAHQIAVAVTTGLNANKATSSVGHDSAGATSRTMRYKTHDVVTSIAMSNSSGARQSRAAAEYDPMSSFDELAQMV